MSVKLLKRTGKRSLQDLVQMYGEDWCVNAIDKYLRARERVRKCDRARKSAE